MSVSIPPALVRPEPLPLSDRVTWSVREVAAATGLSVRTIQQAVTRGDLTPVKIGRRTLFRPIDIQAWIDRQVGAVG